MLANILDISFVNEHIAAAKIGKTGYAFVVDNTGLIIAHPVDGQDLQDQPGRTGRNPGVRQEDDRR